MYNFVFIILQFVLPPPSDGIHFNLYKFTLEPNSQCELAITWQPSEYGNMRKLIKLEQVDFNRKYDFVILGNCTGSPHKKFKVSDLIIFFSYFIFNRCKKMYLLSLFLFLVGPLFL